MRYAIISDVHANEAALRAVLTDAADMQAEKIVCLGEISDPYGGDLDRYKACLADIEAAEKEAFGESDG